MRSVVDTVIAVGQGLGLAAAAGLISAAPVAIGATAATQDLLEDPASFASRAWLVAIAWAAVVIEFVADTVWPGAGAGGRLIRRVIAGGIAFELAAGGAVPYAGLAIGALVAAAVGLGMRRVRSGAVKAGGDVRGTALIEDGAGVGASLVALIPIVGYVMALAGGFLLLRVRRREGQKYEGLRVLR
jgi:hypothetical protein